MFRLPQHALGLLLALSPAACGDDGLAGDSMEDATAVCTCVPECETAPAGTTCTEGAAQGLVSFDLDGTAVTIEATNYQYLRRVDGSVSIAVAREHAEEPFVMSVATVDDEPVSYSWDDTLNVDQLAFQLIYTPPGGDQVAIGAALGGSGETTLADVGASGVRGTFRGQRIDVDGAEEPDVIEDGQFDVSW
jgi:hypothetical protein